MGLDVYLYRFKGMYPFKNHEEAAKSFDEICAKNDEATKDIYPEYEKFKKLPESEQEKIQEKSLKATLSVVKGTPWESCVSKYGSIEFNAEERVEKNSKTDSENMFKIGYFRSSYNDGGINVVLRNNGLMDLYGIFEIDRNSHNYHIKPNWKNALKNVRKVIKEFTHIAKEGISCSHYASQGFIKSEQQAIEAFKKELKNKSAFDCYSNQVGTFFTKEPIEVLAIMSGSNCIGTPGSYVIYKSKDGLKWYLTALKIVEETIKYVLAQEDNENYYFHWSA